MTAPDPADPGPQPGRPPSEPTIRVSRLPGPGPAKQVEPPGDGATAAVHPAAVHPAAVHPAAVHPAAVHPADEPTVGLPDRAPVVRPPTLRFGRPAPVRVTVTARPRRPHRIWPWIAAVVLALVVLGVILLVMFLRGATIDGDTDLVGSPSAVAASASV